MRDKLASVRAVEIPVLELEAIKTAWCNRWPTRPSRPWRQMART